MKKLSLPARLGLAHGLADAAAGFLLVSLIHSTDLVRAGLLVLVYNALGFGGQVVAGWWADRHGAYRLATLAGLGGLAVGLGLGLLELSGPAVLLAGLGSAAFHVGGGALALKATPDSSTGPGLFVGPGVFGLAVGSVLGLGGSGWVGVTLIGALLLMSGSLAGRTADQGAAQTARPTRLELRNAPALIIYLVLLGIALRSAAWDAVQFWQGGQSSSLIAMGAAAMTGKLAGGWLGDRVGWWVWTVGSLAGAALLLSFGGGWLPAVLLGVSLLQSSTPLTLRLVADHLPHFPASASGLTLGLAIALGGLPALLGLEPLLANAVGLTVLLGGTVGLFGWLSKFYSRQGCIPPSARLTLRQLENKRL